MSPPPHIPGGPGIELPPKLSRNDPRVEVETDAEVMSDAATVKAFRSVKLSSAVWVTAITVIGSIVTTYMVTHAAPSDCASKGDMNAAQLALSKMDARLTTLSTTVATNGDTAHNENVKLETTVNRNADRTDNAIQRLNDKLDLFMRR